VVAQPHWYPGSDAVDHSARIQTVHANTNPLFHRLLKRFKELTGYPVLDNTSFNVLSERSSAATQLDLLVSGNCILPKMGQDP